MKRKIAAAIAAVMAFTALAVPSFGVSAASIITNYGENTLVTSHYSNLGVGPNSTATADGDGYKAVGTGLTIHQGINWGRYDVGARTAGDIDVTLPIYLNDTPSDAVSQSFVVTLTNAKWAFLDNIRIGNTDGRSSYYSGTTAPNRFDGSTNYANTYGSPLLARELFPGTVTSPRIASSLWYGGSDLQATTPSPVINWGDVPADDLVTLQAALLADTNAGTWSSAAITSDTTNYKPNASEIQAELEAIIAAYTGYGAGAEKPTRATFRTGSGTLIDVLVTAVSGVIGQSDGDYARSLIDAALTSRFAVGTSTPLTGNDILAANLTGGIRVPAGAGPDVTAKITTIATAADADSRNAVLAGYTYGAHGTSVSGRSLSFRIDVDPFNWNRATVTYFTGNRTAYRGDFVELPIIVATGNGDPVTYAVDNSLGANVANVSNGQLSLGGRGTTLSVPSTKEGTTELALDTLYITEKTFKSITNTTLALYTGDIVLEAPSGYQFKGFHGAAATGGATGPNIAGNVISNTGNLTPGELFTGVRDTAAATLNPPTSGVFGNNRRITIPVTVSSGGTSVAGAFIAIKNLVIVREGGLEPEYGKDITVSVYDDDATTATTVTKTGAGSSVVVGKFVKASIDYWTANTRDTTKPVPVIKSGYRNQKAIEVNFEETASNSWWASPETTFQLTDAEGKVLNGVKFTSLDAAKVTGFDDPSTKNLGTDALYSTAGEKKNDAVGHNKNNALNYYFNGDSNAFSTRGLVQKKVADFASPTQSVADKGKFVFTPKLSVDLNFAGDIYLSVQNGTYNFNDDGYVSNGRRVLIAKAEKQVEISTTTTNVQIGSQRIDVAKVQLVELAKGAVRYDASKSYTLDFTLGEFGQSRAAEGISFVPQATVTIEGGDLQMGDTTVGTNELKIKSKKASSSTASTVVVSGLQITVNRAVPFGTYEMWVGGTAIRDNKSYLKDTQLSAANGTYDCFDTFGMRFDQYVNIKTEAVNNAFANKVVITQGDDVSSILVNGEAKELGYTHPVTGEFVVAYAKTINNRLYIPIRAMADAFGAGPADISWSSVTQTATVRLNGMVVTWTLDSATYTAANGAKIGMPDNCVDTMIDDLNYISIRAFAEAFNIPLAWDAETSTATLNPTASAAVQH